MFKQLKYIKWSFLALMLVIIAAIIASIAMSKGAAIGAYSSAMMLLGGLLLGGLIAALAFGIWYSRRLSRTQVSVKESSQTMLESVKKVFKIVLVEGQFSDIYDYEETEKILGLIPSTKKALVMNTSNVMLGFDVNKCIWEVDEEQKILRIVQFPDPEILSMDTDIKYYNMENGIFNRFDKDDYQIIQNNVKTQVKNAVEASDLPQLAQEQIKVLLQEVLGGRDWMLASSSPQLLLD